MTTDDTSNFADVIGEYAELLGFEADNPGTIADWSSSRYHDEFMIDPTSDRWAEAYSGDIDPITHGGVYVTDRDNWVSGLYAECVRVTQACDNPYPVFIEKIVALRPGNLNSIKEMADCRGPEWGDYMAAGHESRHLMEIFAAVAYGHYDPDDNPFQKTKASLLIADWQDDYLDFVEYCAAFDMDPADTISRDRAYDILSQWVKEAECHGLTVCTEEQAYSRLCDML